MCLTVTKTAGKYLVDDALPMRIIYMDSINMSRDSIILNSQIHEFPQKSPKMFDDHHHLHQHAFAILLEP